MEQWPINAPIILSKPGDDTETFWLLKELARDICWELGEFNWAIKSWIEDKISYCEIFYVDIRRYK
jgi:hypothetical protein